jgi:hypothetical protein
MEAFEYSAYNMNRCPCVETLTLFHTSPVPEIFGPFQYSFNAFELRLKDSSSYFTDNAGLTG